ncbi:ubiquitin-associated protein 1-like isoform X1 [Myripristis murdjan]|uniref:Ubiquitin associated protein 1 like n=1 Tax=Myripristis murdjan TaxID=586833 RepID=A0A667ZAJ3_9TELE|nr:ubiquitin-associated protein 1-like isoform X1 [Myripristis murdjan]XP_029904108.1 ubiquitin-associated protein 1-like isoform X1 [Myripristis murdjan]XP_029904109.1 ubiquitin-associated protein 1-like isoform X1 [Myripristis murdjan]
MSGVDGVPLKMPPAALQEVQQQMEVSVPDYLTILQETEYEFSLENWVLTGLQSGYSGSPHPAATAASSPSGLQPSCPPYWLMFSSPQQSRLASRHSSDFWEPNPRQRSRSLNLAVLRSAAVSESKDEGDGCAGKAKASRPEEASPAASGQPGPRKAQRAFVPNLLTPPACLSSLPHQRRKNLRQCSLSSLETASRDLKTGSQSQSSSAHRPPNTRANTVDRVPTITYQQPQETSVAPPNPLAPRTPSPSLSSSDSTVELLSALSPEERELLGAVTARGYPLHTAILALQKTGQQSPEQILSYLVAWDHLCALGYDEAQVEEALEMFQNCETKAAEFLQLLRQFHEMGFQQNAIKEVLLVHENHRERALEELMMHVA